MTLANDCSSPPICRCEHCLQGGSEELRTDAQGNHHFLGYVLYLGSAAIYHSGDCVPFAGLDEELAACGVDVALLPVNGRDQQRRSHGILGNFTFDEATAHLYPL